MTDAQFVRICEVYNKTEGESYCPFCNYMTVPLPDSVLLEKLDLMNFIANNKFSLQLMDYCYEHYNLVFVFDSCYLVDIEQEIIC